MDGSAVAADAAADDDEVIVVLGGDRSVACEGGSALHRHPARERV